MTRADIDDSCWQELANAIVLQAVSDYRKLCRTERKGPLNSSDATEKKRIPRFFCGSWFKMLTDIDGFELLKQLDSEMHYVHTHINL